MTARAAATRGVGDAGRARLARLTVALVVALAAPRAARSQTEYYNLDASRPLRVEDAVPTERYGLDLDLAPVRFERYDGGVMRLRFEPKVSVGLFPLTDVEVRVPLVFSSTTQGTNPPTNFGVAGVGVGVLHALNVESARWPAIALGVELLLPSGPMSGPNGSYSLRALASRTTTLGRLNLNLAYGTYSVRSAVSLSDPSCAGYDPNVCGGLGVPFDIPCNVIPSPRAASTARAPDAPRYCDRAPPRAPRMLAAGERFDPARSWGNHWLAAFGYDLPFGLKSTLLSADVVAERFLGLYALTDWTAEVGVRHQLAPRLVVDAGVGRHFAGVSKSSMATLGLSYELPVRSRAAGQ